MIRRQNRLKLLRDGPLHRDTVVADFVGTFETWLPFDNFDDSAWIHRQWVEMFLKKCGREIREARNKGRGGKKRPAADVGERTNTEARCHQSPRVAKYNVHGCDLPGVECQGYYSIPRPTPAKYTDVRHRQELIDLIDKNELKKEPYTLTSRFKCTLENEELNEEYMGLYTNGEMITDLIYGQISYHCGLSNIFKLKLAHDLKIFWVEMKRATGKAIAEHLIRPAKVIPLAVFRLDVRKCYSLYIDFERF
jgi:hypothetical protein